MIKKTYIDPEVAKIVDEFCDSGSKVNAWIAIHALKCALILVPQK